MSARPGAESAGIVLSGPMTTRAHEIDDTPSALAGLADNKLYVLQHVTGADVMLAEAAVAPPAASVASHVLRRGEWLQVRSDDDLTLWVWTAAGTARLGDDGDGHLDRVAHVTVWSARTGRHRVVRVDGDEHNPAHYVVRGASVHVTPAAGRAIYAWTTGGEARLVTTEAG